MLGGVWEPNYHYVIPHPMLQTILWCKGAGVRELCSSAMLSVLPNHVRDCVLTFLFKARRGKKKTPNPSPSYCDLVLHEAAAEADTAGKRFLLKQTFHRSSGARGKNHMASLCYPLRVFQVCNPISEII